MPLMVFACTPFCGDLLKAINKDCAPRADGSYEQCERRANGRRNDYAVSVNLFADFAQLSPHRCGVSVKC